MVKKIVIILLCIFIVLGFYGFYISKNKIEITEYTYDSNKINHDINIVMISDVHDQHTKHKDKVIKKIKELSPDLILCVGDIIDDTSSNDESTLSFLQSLLKIAPVYMSMGNHEITYYESHSNDLSHITSLGVTLLDEEYKDVKVNNETIRIGGMYNYAFSEAVFDNKSKTVSYLEDFVDTDNYKLMMAHRPDSFIFGDAYKWDIDLVCSGHYHGGQVIIPFLGGLYAPDLGMFPYYDYGKYSLHDMQLIITRGLASSNEKLPRFNNPGEIVSIKLK